jgi:Mrp family chromosome partitioning ATPase/DUF971 family protein
MWKASSLSTAKWLIARTHVAARSRALLASVASSPHITCGIHSCTDHTASIVARTPHRHHSTRVTLSPHEKSILKLLGTVHHPTTKADIVFAGHVRSVREKDGHVSIVLPLDEAYRELKKTITATVEGKKLEWVKSVRVVMESAAPSTAAAASSTLSAKAKDGLSNVKHIIAVSSCKGGVGKSTVAVNLAYALSRLHIDDAEGSRDLRVGILDADIYGPSLPTMVSPPSTALHVNSAKRLIPPVYEGVKLMSYGFVGEGQKAKEKLGPGEEGKSPTAAAVAASAAGAFIRGPLASAAVRQMAAETEWGGLDFLVIDMPPGTGDVQLTLTQLLKFSGAVVVTTPQKLALVDVAKGLELFRKTAVPVLAVVENMAYFTCGKCDTKHRIFGAGGDALLTSLKREYSVPHVVEVPITTELSEAGDKGDPFVLATSRGDKQAGVREAYETLAKIVQQSLLTASDAVPTLTYNAETREVVLQEPATPGATASASTHRLSARSLRLACRCAACVDETTGRPKLLPSKVPEDVKPLGVETRGRYAVAVRWSDGHASSIYPFEDIRKMAGAASNAQSS